MEKKSKEMDNQEYHVVSKKIYYLENLDLLKDKYTEEEFLKLEDSMIKKISEDLELNFKFVLTFGTAITAFYPMIESFIVNSRLSEVKIDKSTVVYLTICSLAIVFGTPKSKYRKLFNELRMRNVYALLEPTTVFIKRLNIIFNFICSKIGKVFYDVYGMFNYSVLFVPFALTLTSLFTKNEITIENIIASISEDGEMKLYSIAIGVTGITIREVITSLIKNLLSFEWKGQGKSIIKYFSGISSKTNSMINKLNDKIDIDNTEEELSEKELNGSSEEDDESILKFNQWKEKNNLPDTVKRIDEKQ